MHASLILTLAIFVAGYITARWDLVTRLYDLAIFAWDHGVVVGLKNSSIPVPADLPILDAHCQRVRSSLDFLLPIYYTSREASLEGEQFGMEDRF